MHWVDRLLTIIITATLTSAVWIVAGGSIIENADGKHQRATTDPAKAAPDGDVPPAPEPTGATGGDMVRSIIQGSDDGQSDESRQLMIPVLNVRADDLKDTFSTERDEGGPSHEALDIGAPAGTSVVAAAAGTIERLYRSQAGGNTIYIRSPDGKTIYYYAHLGEYAPGLNEGQSIRRGQRLGTVGSSGNASPDRPHLHFAIMRTTPDAEWWEPANAVNPYPMLGGQPREATDSSSAADATAGKAG